MRLQAQSQMAAQAQQFEIQKHKHLMEMEGQRATQDEQFSRWKAELEAQTKITVAQVNAQPVCEPMMMNEPMAEIQILGDTPGGMMTP